ncbi:FAD-dependent oxidoreductase [Gramella sp. BOM4]|nr:FAD-dependent oxidoreductase [Christiangramia bathymodioli]
MDKKDYKIYIIGAGLSGLIAARVLEDHGYYPEIFESGDEVGGRIRTDDVEGFRLDRGFQVLLSEYPKVKQYLDLESLDVVDLLPGAVIFKDSKLSRLGDPTREPSLLLSSILSNVASISDKYRIFRLYLDLKNKSLKEIFEEKESTTLEYLKEKGFTEKVIANFFRPFFSGIFLEPDLKTSSRMFCFVFKMFGEGKALIPRKGMGEISKYLAAKLKNTKIHFNCPVKEVTDSQIILENEEKVSSHFTIIATEAAPLISNLRNQQISWKSCHCFYFTTKTKRFEGRIIGLIADDSALINNIFYHSSLEEEPVEGDLISVTIVKPTELNKNELELRVRQELKKLCGIEVDKLLKHYKIPKALPDIRQLQYEIMPTETRLNNRIFLAGDQLLNGSQNAAMLSGERAALGLIGVLEGGAVTAEITSEYL